MKIRIKSDNAHGIVFTLKEVFPEDENNKEGCYEMIRVRASGAKTHTYDLEIDEAFFDSLCDAFYDRIVKKNYPKLFDGVIKNVAESE